MAQVGMRYSEFAPRVYNLAKSLGFTPGKMMPSRAFCSDESQGYPIIQIAKQFGTFPFNHGRVGGMIALDRHGPHAHHGMDLLSFMPATLAMILSRVSLVFIADYKLKTMQKQQAVAKSVVR